MTNYEHQKNSLIQELKSSQSSHLYRRRVYRDKRPTSIFQSDPSSLDNNDSSTVKLTSQVSRSSSLSSLSTDSGYNASSSTLSPTFFSPVTFSPTTECDETEGVKPVFDDEGNSQCLIQPNFVSRFHMNTPRSPFPHQTVSADSVYEHDSSDGYQLHDEVTQFSDVNVNEAPTEQDVKALRGASPPAIPSSLPPSVTPPSSPIPLKPHSPSPTLTPMASPFIKTQIDIHASQRVKRSSSLSKMADSRKIQVPLIIKADKLKKEFSICGTRSKQRTEKSVSCTCENIKSTLKINACENVDNNEGLLTALELEHRGNEVLAPVLGIEHQESEVLSQALEFEYRDSELKCPSLELEHRDSEVISPAPEFEHRDSEVIPTALELEHRGNEVLAPVLRIKHQESEVLSQALELEHRDREVILPALELEHRDSEVLSQSLEFEHRDSELKLPGLELEHRDSDVISTALELEHREREVLSPTLQLGHRESEVLSQLLEIEHRENKVVPLALELENRENEVLSQLEPQSRHTGGFIGYHDDTVLDSSFSASSLSSDSDSDSELSNSSSDIRSYDITAPEAELNSHLLPFKISKLEDYGTVKQRIKPGMVADVRNVFVLNEKRIRRRQRKLSKRPSKRKHNNELCSRPKYTHPDAQEQVYNKEFNESDNEEKDDSSVEQEMYPIDDTDEDLKTVNVHASEDDVIYRYRRDSDHSLPPSFIDNLPKPFRKSQREDDIIDDRNLNMFDISSTTIYNVKHTNIDGKGTQVLLELPKIRNDTERRACTCILNNNDQHTDNDTMGVVKESVHISELHDKLQTNKKLNDCSTGGDRLMVCMKDVQSYNKGGRYVSRVNVLPVAKQYKYADRKDTINKYTSVSDTADDEVSEACLTPGHDDKVDNLHVVTNIILTNGANPPQGPNDKKDSEGTDVLFVKLNTPSLTLAKTTRDEVSVNSKESSNTESKMPEKSSGSTSFSEEVRDGKRITTKYSSLPEVNGDVTMDNDEQGEAKQQLKLLAEAMSKLQANGDDNQDILPQIQQSLTKLDGGNLIVTTLTRRILEEEENETPPSPPVEVPTNVYLIQDHEGRVYMVEDITDESDESYSTNLPTTISQENYYNRIHNLQSVGKSNIDYSTAEELLLGLYNRSAGTLQIEEIDESTNQRQIEKRPDVTDYSNLQNNNQYGYLTDDLFNRQTSTRTYDLMGGQQYEQPQQMPNSSSTVKTVKQSYEMTSSSPWGRGADDAVSSIHGEDDTNMQREETIATTNIDNTGFGNSTFSTYRYQTDATLVPQVSQVPLLPLPVVPFIPPPQPQCKLVQLDMTPIQASTPVKETKVTESKNEKAVTGFDETDHKVTTLSDPGRPVYKSVALVKGSYETPKWHKAKQKGERELDDSKAYKIVSTKASDDVQEKHMSYENSSSAYRVTRSETFDDRRNASNACRSLNGFSDHGNSFRTEKLIHVNGAQELPKTHRTKIDVTNPNDFVDSRNYNADATNYEYSEHNKTVTTTKMQTESGYPVESAEPYIADSGGQGDIRVVRGNILIKNSLDQGLDEFSDNINLFHSGFNMRKDNPLYQSDEDINRRSEEEMLRKQAEAVNRIKQDVAYETEDRYTKTKNVKRDPPKQYSRHNFSTQLLSRLSNFDAKDIRQHIDVKHNNEEIYGDARFMGGKQSSSSGSNNFDSVGEDIDLVMKAGKAYITIKATAERYSPIDLEFNIWRKSQAIVTRVIEIDFQANEQRRMLYEQVMTRADDRGHSEHGGRHGHLQEHVLSTQETLDLFSEIMGATDGEGDHEDITVKTSQRKTAMLPQDFMY